MSPDTELRHIKASTLVKVSAIIDQSNGFHELLDSLSRPIQHELSRQKIDPLKLSIDQIDQLKQEFYRGRSPALALLKYWSITGRTRPTISTLYLFLKRAKLERAADHIKDYLDNPIRTVDQHPAIDQPFPNTTQSESYVNDEEDSGYMVDDEYRFDNLSDIFEQLKDEYDMFSFSNIYESSNKFCHRPYDHDTGIGTRIGDGRFSSVFRASVKPKQYVAVKLLRSDCNRDYLVNELKLAKNIKHENVLELIGLSVNSDSKTMSYLCLIYPYMENGSLQNCLSSGLICNNKVPLNCTQRYEIAIGVAKGIDYLHNSGDKPIVHRDIKSANILIDSNVTPKIGDFTLVRQLEPSNDGETKYTANVIGTSIYMPPEAFRGDISTKFDIYSFGVVLLELLTGMKPFNDVIQEDLLTFVCERLFDLEDDDKGSRDEFLQEILDERAGIWNSNESSLLFDLAIKSTENRKSHRPTIREIVRRLSPSGDAEQ